MAAKNRELVYFVSNNTDMESRRLSRSGSRSDDFHEQTFRPIEAISDGESAYASMPFGKYTSHEVVQLWTEAVKQFEEKLKPLYDNLMSDLEERSRCNLRQHTSTQEKSEQRHKILQAMMHEMCDKICTCIEKKFMQISGQPRQPYVASSFPLPRVDPSRLHRDHRQGHEESEEISSLPLVMLVSTDGHYIASDIQFEGQPTCAVIVSRNNHDRTNELLSNDGIKSQSYQLVESNESIHEDNIESVNSEANADLEAAHHKHLGSAHGDSRIVSVPLVTSAVMTHTFIYKEETYLKSDVKNSDEEVKEKPGVWNRFLDRREDADVKMVPVKEIKMAQQQEERLKSEIIKLEGIINEKDSLLAEKERTIKILENVHTAASGYIQSGHGHLSGMIAHCDDLTKRIPSEIPVAKSMESGNKTHPRAHQLKENEYDGEDEEKQPLKPTRKSAKNCEAETSMLQFTNNMLPTLETVKNPYPEVKAPKKPPSKKTTEKKLASKTEAENCSSNKPDETTKLEDKPTETSPEPTEKSSIDGKSEDVKKLCSVDDETNSLKVNKDGQQANCDTTPKNENNLQNHGGDPSNDKGTPV